jgi:parvulin-like peptidyl-prolyl isomerase
MSNMRNAWGTIFRLFLAAGFTAAVSACDSDKAQPVSAQDFYTRRSAPAAIPPISPLDRPGIIPLPDAHAQAPAVPPPSNDSLGEPTAGDFHPLPPGPPTTSPSVSFAAPATAPSIATDQYMILGGVVVVVNGTPIYANKVLRKDIDVLRGYAKQMDIVRFEDAARAQIERTVGELVKDELEVAAAERTLDPKDIQLAHVFTTLWSQNQIAQAGGSEQVARLRAQESGEDFEDQEQDTYRRYLQELYYFKVISPQIDITAEDERRYYHAHVDQFTTPTQASIILIEANPAKLNGDAKAARARLLNIRQRALSGEDFADYGRRQNDLPGSAGDQGNGGQMTLKPNTLVLTNVEAQVWKTPPGQISDIIEDHDAFFIFKVISRDEGGTKPFADRAVQEAITKRLTDLQRTERREAEIQKLEMEAIGSPENLEPVVEMAIQNYPAWSKK